VIVHDTHNLRAIAIRQQIEPEDAALGDVVAVIGGDGFLLQTAAAVGWDRTFLGLNAGRIGFLLNDTNDQTPARIRARAWRVWQFPLVAATITAIDGKVSHEAALNDIYLERMTGQTANLELAIDGHPVVDCLVADGVIFSTALGSTAYAYSAGGPACHPGLRTLSVTPICPHQPRLSPLVLPETASAHVVVRSPEKRPVRAVADGRVVNDVASVEIVLGPGLASLAYFEGHDFTGRLIRKLLRTGNA
jgi:NAD+ kinase